MDTQWSSSSVDLLFDVEGQSRRREGIERVLRVAIRQGRLLPGAKLPSTRALASDLGLARGTVTEAYAQLAAEGYVLTRHGSGTVVTYHLRSTPKVSSPAVAEERLRYGFHPGTPDLSLFPRARWAAAARSALNRAPDGSLGYGDPLGHPDLRRALAGYLARTRGVVAPRECVVICSGFVQALNLVGEILRSRGVTAVAMEDPCIPEHRAVVRSAGLEIIPIPVDAEGMRVDLLPALRRGAAIVTPAHQFPLGVTLAPARRAELLRWARGNDAFVLEDDYDGEFRYDRQPIGALQGLDPDRVLYAGTASKSLAPGLRLGWLVVPASLLGQLSDAKRNADRQTGIFDQLTMAEFTESGQFDRHVRRCRVEYRRRRDSLVAQLAAEAPAFRVDGVAAGLQALVWSPPGGPSGESLVARARSRSVLLLPAAPCWHGSPPPGEGVLVGFGAPAQYEFGSALDALVSVLRDA